ncbi:MAG TPA: DMT family transporter, partial [Flavitalea sp.]|nr:DMT family transporter [Flavitalea sp.]
NIFFGINFSVVQYITHGKIHPFGLNVIRVGVSVLLLWVIWLFVVQKAGIHRRDIGRFILCAITGVVINQSLFIKGLSMTLSIHAALLILVTPIFITIVAAWVGTEAMTVWKTVGLLAGISGAAILALDKQHAGTAQDVLLGDIFIIINAISYAIYFALVKPLMSNYNPVHVIRWIFTIGFVMMLPIGWSEFREISWSGFSAIDYTALAFIVLGATFFAYLFNLYGINHLGSGITGTYIYTQPFFASLIAVWFLGEVFTRNKIVAAILIASGVLLVSLKSRNKK